MLLLRAALDADLPTLAICRGMQLMVVAYGGRSSTSTCPTCSVTTTTGRRPGAEKFGSHAVRFAPGSLVHRLLGASTTVNSFHHQGVADVGALTATGWVPDEVLPDGSELVEVVEDPTQAGSRSVCSGIRRTPTISASSPRWSRRPP